MSTISFSYGDPPEILPLQLFSDCAQAGQLEKEHANWRRLDEHDLWREFCLCVLSSRTRFELASEAVDRLERSGVLARMRAKPTNVHHAEVEAVLRPRKDGKVGARGIPFWRSRSAQLLGSAAALYAGRRKGLKSILLRIGDPERVRSEFVSTLPGMGMKQASHFLQNIGFSRDLAIIDTHLLSFIIEDLMLIRFESHGVSERMYMDLERRVQRMAAANGFSLRQLDRAIWRSKQR